MSLISYHRGQGSIILRVKVLDSTVSTGAGKTGLTNASSGLIISTVADNESAATAYAQAASHIQTIATLGTYAAPSASNCRFGEVDATNHKGVYEIQIADARYAVTSAKSLLVSISGATGAAECDAVIPLMDVDPYDANRGGSLALPNTACTSNASLLTSGTGTDQLQVVTGGATVHTVSANAIGNTSFQDNCITSAKIAASTIAAFWAALTSTMTTVGSIGAKLAVWVLGSDNKSVISADSLPVKAVDGSGNAIATASAQATLQTSVTNITSNTVLARPVLPSFMARPSSSSTAYEVDLNLYTIQGLMETPDAAPTVHARDGSGTSLDAHLSATTMTLIAGATGRYKVTYTVNSTDTTGEVIFDFAWAVNSVAIAAAGASEIQDAESLSTLAAVKTQTDKIGTNAADSPLATAAQSTIATNLNATVASRLATSGYTAPDNADIVTALNDLVTLLARTDPTSALAAVKTVTDGLATMLMASGPNKTYTIDALKNAPAGGGGAGNPKQVTDKQRTIIDQPG